MKKHEIKVILIKVRRNMEREIFGLWLWPWSVHWPCQARGEAAEEMLEKKNIGDGRSSQGEEENHRGNRVEEE